MERFTLSLTVILFVSKKPWRDFFNAVPAGSIPAASTIPPQSLTKRGNMIILTFFLAVVIPAWEKLKSNERDQNQH